VLWQEILKRFPCIELVGEPTRTKSNFVHGFTAMTALIPARRRAVSGRRRSGPVPPGAACPAACIRRAAG
jgi:hypothetical protein